MLVPSSTSISTLSFAMLLQPALLQGLPFCRACPFAGLLFARQIDSWSHKKAAVQRAIQLAEADTCGCHACMLPEKPIDKAYWLRLKPIRLIG